MKVRSGGKCQIIKSARKTSLSDYVLVVYYILYSPKKTCVLFWFLGAHMANQDIGSPVEDASFDQEVQTIFFHALAPLFQNLRRWLHHDQGPRSFDAHDYVHSQPVASQAFCRALVQTSSFRRLLAELCHRPYGLPFEEALVYHQLDDTSTHSEAKAAESVCESQFHTGLSSFQSCTSQSNSEACFTSHAVLLQHDASHPSRMKASTPWLELHLYHPPAQPQWKGHNLRVLATWERPKQAVAQTH